MSNHQAEVQSEKQTKRGPEFQPALKRAMISGCLEPCQSDVFLPPWELSSVGEVAQGSFPTNHGTVQPKHKCGTHRCPTLDRESAKRELKCRSHAGSGGLRSSWPLQSSRKLRQQRPRLPSRTSRCLRHFIDIRRHGGSGLSLQGWVTFWQRHEQESVTGSCWPQDPARSVSNVPSHFQGFCKA